MPFAETLSGYFVDWGETVTVSGTAVTAIFDTGYVEALGAAGIAPSVLCAATDVAFAVVGDSVVRASVTYTVRNILPEPPDASFTRLVLEST